MKRRLLSSVLACLVVPACMTFAQGEFRHPGLLHSEADFEAVKQRIADEDETAVSALAALRTAPPVNGDHGGNWAVNEYIARGISGSENYMNAYRNAARAYQCALLWKITGETAYGDIAIDILNAYRMYNKGLSGNTNVSLIPGFIGYQFINAAEIMRDYSGWSDEDFELFKQYMIDVWFTTAQDFLERRHDTVTNESNWYHYHSNWGLGNALFCVSLGVLCDLPDIYNYGMYWLKEGPGNESLCVTALHPDAFGEGLCGYGWGLIPWFHEDERGPLGYLNQMQESGRDQGHSMAALGLLSYAFESAFNQGDNAFCNLNNSVVSGKAGSAMVAGAAEYVAAYNNGYDDLPFTTNWWMTGLSATSRGQWRPIWQLFINHYQNKMGIPMAFCSEMKETIGMELGGGSYGTNSGGYDHTGFGDLMYNDDPVSEDEVPTILFPMISSADETRKYAEIRDVEPGTTLTLSASLPDGETDTGNWEWEDGVTGQQRMITADHAGLYRLTYTNANGIQSTQLFSIAVRGEGIKATLTATAIYNGQEVEGTDVLMGLGRSLSVTTSYPNWNYIESEIWYDEDGNQLGTGGSYTYTLKDNEEHKLVFQLTNQSGVVIEVSYNIIPNENELTGDMADPDCENPDLWTTTADGFEKATSSVTSFSQPYIQRLRDATEDGMSCWGQERFDISQTMTGLKEGKYQLGAAVIATQQDKSDDAARDYVKDLYLYAGGAVTAVSSLSSEASYYQVEFYVGSDGQFTYGFKNMTDQNHGYSENGFNWFAMDNFSLIYEGDTELADDLAAMREEAAAVTEDDAPTALISRLAALESADATVETAVSYQSLLAEVQMLSVHYSAYKAAYESYKEFAEAESADHSALDETLEAFAAAVTADEVFKAYDAMDAAWREFITEADNVADLTTYLPDHGDLPATDGYYDYLTRWMTDASDGNFRAFAIDGSDASRGDATGENMLERWCTTSFYADEQLIYFTLTDLPEGRYKFSTAVQKGAAAGVINLFANDETAPVCSIAELGKTEVSACVTDGKLTVGIKSGTDNGCQWTSMADMTISYESPLRLLKEAVEASDTLDYGTDNDGALAAAVSQANALISSGTAADRMDAYETLQDAMEQYRMDNASEEHPVDMTDYADNAGFDINNAAGWTTTSSSTSYPQFADGVIEFWHCTFDITQTLTGLPVGNYRISVQARSDFGADNTSFGMYVNTTGGTASYVYSTATARADGTSTSLHLGQNAEDLNADASESRISQNVFVGDGKLIIGASCEATDIWCVMNDFVIEYLGMDSSDLLQAWWAQVAVANSLSRDTLPQAEEEVLDNLVAVDANSITQDSLSVALTALMNEIENARDVMDAYTDYLELKAIVEEIAENSQPQLTSSLTLLQSSMTSCATQAEAATTSSELATVYSTLETARQTYVVNATPLNGIGFDMTFKISSAECTSTTGWEYDATVNFRTLTNTSQNSAYSGTFLENWIGPGNELTDGERPIFQTISTLPNGNYKLTAAAFRKVELSTADESDMSISLYLNDQQTEVTSEVLDYHTVWGVVSSRTAEIGLTSGEGNTANWVGLADVSLIYYGSDDIELDEDDTEFAVTGDTYGSVTLTQSLTSDSWNLVCLPFSLTSSQVRKVFDDVKILSDVEINGSECNLMFEDVREMEAGVPYLVQVDESVSELSFSSVTVLVDAIADGGTVVENGSATFTLVGTDHKTTTEADYAYTYSGNAFTLVDAGTELKGFSAQLVIEGFYPSQLNIYVDDELVTGIKGVTASADSEESATGATVYTIDGRMVRRGMSIDEATRDLKPGLYIVNGKKMLVK